MTTPHLPRQDTTPPAQPTEQAETFEIETRTEMGRVVGRLPRSDQRRLRESVGAVVQRWFNAAYVGGDYPRSDFHDAFPGFTPGARDEAKRDKALMTNITHGSRIDDVTPTRSQIRLDVLSVRKRPVGVTARFLLGFRTEGKYERRVAVRGRLMLTRQESGWKIFAYDVAKEGRA